MNSAISVQCSTELSSQLGVGHFVSSGVTFTTAYVMCITAIFIFLCITNIRSFIYSLVNGVIVGHSRRT